MISSLLSACAPDRAASQPPNQALTIFAAASLNQAFSEIGRAFEGVHPGVHVAFNFAGSQTLSAQIIEGAQADIFASANHVEMDKLVSAGLIQADEPKDFTSNQLVVILPPGNPAGLTTLKDLARPGLKLDLADPSVPAGKYARQVLENLGKDPAYGADYDTRVLANVVSNETDVEVVVTKVRLGEVDAGIVYMSDTSATPGLKTIDSPAGANILALYPIAVLERSSQPDLAAAFVAFVLSPEGAAALEKWGFGPVSP